MNTLLAFALALTVLSGLDADRLDPKIGPAVPGKYEAVRDAKEWLNPYLTVCADGVRLDVVAVKHNAVVAIPELRAALVKLPIKAWPYGRVVALQDCRIRVPEDDDERFRRLTAVAAELIALGVQIDRWPS
jgi:hypothetical protein